MALTSHLPIILVVLSAVSSVNHGFPSTATHTSTVADVTELSTNRVTPSPVTPTAAPAAVSSHVTNRVSPSTSSGEQAGDVTRHGVADEDAVVATVDNHVDAAFVNGENGERREVSDLSESHETENNASASGFPWWTLILVLGATVVIVSAIAGVFYLYNRRLNRRHSIVVNSKRASEVIVDSWIAASRSSIAPVSSSTPSQSGNDEDDIDYRRAAGGEEPQFEAMTAGDGGDEERILGAVGGCDVP